jgi:hypothetical protein
VPERLLVAVLSARAARPPARGAACHESAAFGRRLSYRVGSRIAVAEGCASPPMGAIDDPLSQHAYKRRWVSSAAIVSPQFLRASSAIRFSRSRSTPGVPMTSPYLSSACERRCVAASYSSSSRCFCVLFMRPFLRAQRMLHKLGETEVRLVGYENCEIRHAPQSQQRRLRAAFSIGTPNADRVRDLTHSPRKCKARSMAGVARISARSQSPASLRVVAVTRLRPVSLLRYSAASATLSTCSATLCSPLGT